MHVKRIDNKNRALKELQVVMTRKNDFHKVKCLTMESSVAELTFSSDFRDSIVQLYNRISEV